MNKEIKLPVSKETFVEIFKHIKENRKKYGKLQEALEDLSPGNYCNFWPHFTEENLFIDLLIEVLNLKPSVTKIEEYYVNIIDYYIEEIIDKKPNEIKAEDKEISTPAKLYDYIVKNYDKIKKE